MVESTAEAEFRPYPEIENHYHKMTKAFIENHKGEELWVATEKIHGTNFCFECDGTSVVCAKRNSYLKDSDKFFSFQII